MKVVSCSVSALALRKKCPYLVFFWSIFPRIWTACGDLQSKSPYSIRMQENTDQKNSECGPFLRSVLIAKSYIFMAKTGIFISTKIKKTYPVPRAEKERILSSPWANRRQQIHQPYHHSNYYYIVLRNAYYFLMPWSNEIYFIYFFVNFIHFT